MIFPDDPKLKRAQNLIYKACNIGSISLFNKALKLGADPNFGGSYALWKSIEKNHEEFTIKILHHFNFVFSEHDIFDFHRLELIMLALSTGQFRLFEKMKIHLLEEDLDEISDDFLYFLEDVNPDFGVQNKVLNKFGNEIERHLNRTLFIN
jgi:hypothetical protein